MKWLWLVVMYEAVFMKACSARPRWPPRGLDARRGLSFGYGPRLLPAGRVQLALFPLGGYLRVAAPSGRAIAVDIQPEMLRLLVERAQVAHVTNVQTVLGTSADPKLPAGTCDLILLSDVYHELDDPAAMLGHLERALSARGVLALLEFRAEDPGVPIKPEHKMSRRQILLELGASGFEEVRSFDELPWQHLMFFAPSKPHAGSRR